VTSQLAALDLGSNSFHLVIAENRDGRLQILDKLKDMVRLAEGLDEDNRLDPLVAERALNCLARFSQRLAQIAPENIRVVGTNTLRRARNSRKFLRKAETALGHEIEVITGQEEARLIYLGVSHALEDNHDKRLVVDIGGGSTEMILGQQFKPRKLESLFMGCVSFSRRFFADGRLGKNAMKSARLKALQELEPVEQQFRKAGWDVAIGASGTILAVQEVLEANGWAHQSITQQGLKQLVDALGQAKNIESLSLAGLSADRKAVFPGGVAILTGIFEALKLERMEASTGALREGLLYDLLGRTTSEDIRENSIQDLASRYQIDNKHAQRVEGTAVDLFRDLSEHWPLNSQRHLPLLRWAAALHEVGMGISHRQYHKHGGYLIRNMDLAGFSQTEQNFLALLVRAHRRKFPGSEFERLSEPEASLLLYLSIILRLSVLLHRSRSAEPLPKIKVSAGEDRLQLVFPSGWFAEHLLTELDLSQEADYLAAIPVKLSITQAD